jgi:hypothetical protein
LGFFLYFGLHFSYFWAYLAIFFGLISHYKPLTESLKPKSNHTTTKTKTKTYYKPKPKPKHTTNQNQNILQTKTKTYYTESLKPKPKSPKHTINLQTTESLKSTNANKTDIASIQHMAQNPYVKANEEANITSLQLIIDGTQNPPSIVCAQNPLALSFCIFFIYLSYLTNINN